MKKVEAWKLKPLVMSNKSMLIPWKNIFRGKNIALSRIQSDASKSSLWDSTSTQNRKMSTRGNHPPFLFDDTNIKVHEKLKGIIVHDNAFWQIIISHYENRSVLEMTYVIWNINHILWTGRIIWMNNMHPRVNREKAE